MSGDEDLAGKLRALRAMTGRRFWRGLDDLVVMPAFREALADAFPGLTEMGDWRRRDILKCLGGALALAGLDGCERLPDGDAQPAVVQEEGEEPGIARYYATAVELDGVGQPVVGKTRMARPIKLEGNGAHPACRGATDAFTQAALLDLYDPERSAAPAFQGAIADWARADAMLAEVRAELDRSGGEGFRLLTGPVQSPTLLRQIGMLLDRHPKARWHSWSPIAQRQEERLALHRAHVVVAFDDDPIGPGPLQTFHASNWAARRRAYQHGDGAAALFVAEPSPTLTGVAATDRLVAREDRMAALLLALGKALGEAVPIVPTLTSREADWVDKAARALRVARGKGLIAVGAHHPAALRNWALEIDRRLGNFGVTRSKVVAPRGEGHGKLGALMADMLGGRVATLLVLDSNPVFAAPGFGDAMAHVPMRLHAGLHQDETAWRCHWHLPLAHSLESWSDTRAADGSAVIVQPLVQPWLAVRSRHDVLAALTGEDRKGVALVRASWPGLDDDGWRQALLEGRVPEELPTSPPVTYATVPPMAASSSALTVIMRPDPCIWDGRFASNPWLQELPKPLTKIDWGSAIHVSPALAREKGLENGDRVRLYIGQKSLEGPVWILPGQERRTILLHLGHGRTRGGRVARGVGFDVNPLLEATGSVALDRVEGRESIVSTQTHFAMQGEEFVRYVATAADHLPPPPPRESFFPHQKSGPAWGMAIDLDLCIGCNACVVACVAENNIPMVGPEQVAKGREMHWLRIDRYQDGPLDEPRHAFQPVPCMHCEDAPCEMGCPVNATVHSPDGLNLQVYNRCIGTRTCSAYCPYKVRRFNWFDLTSADPPELRAVRNPDVTVRSRGVMEKCTYCIQRISAARITAKKEDRPIREGEVVTACQAVCPTQAIVFGDVSQAGTGVRQRKDNGRDYDLLREANTRPRTTYQARIEGGGEG